MHLSVVGAPKPKGDGRKLPNGGFMVGRDSKGSKAIIAWDDAICRAAEPITLAGHTAFDEPVIVSGYFAFPVVASSPDRLYHQGSPDLDKLFRTTGDALQRSGIVINDARIVWWDVRKVYAVDDIHVGAELDIIPFGESERLFREHRRLERAAARKKARPGRTGQLAMAVRA